MRPTIAKTEIGRERFDLVFDQIDRDKGTGRIIGNQGGGDVLVVAAREAMTLLERTAAGVFQVTVIYSARNADGSYKAVHSRHTVGVGGEPIPSQYYGSCMSLM